MQKIPILMYHSISHPIKNAPFKCLHLPPKRFALQMTILKLLGYQGLSMYELTPYLKGKKQGKVIGITFDDGYRNNLTQALPILQRHGFTATCYVVSGHIGGHNQWDEAKGIPKNPLMSDAELKQWLNAGMEVGVHTHSHISLIDVDDATAEQEITHSKQFLEELLGVPMRHFCYPYGKFHSSHVAMLKQQGFDTATAMYRGRTEVPQGGLTSDELLTLPRVTVNNNCYPHIFLAKLLTNYEDKKGARLRLQQTSINPPCLLS